jgi:hypothetical protein
LRRLFGMLSAFTSELFLKCIICIEKGHSPREHDLKVLFDMLSVQTRGRLEQIWVEHIAAAGDRLAEMERITGVTYARDLSAALSACGKTFAKVRYGYEGEDRFAFYLSTLPDMLGRAAFELRPDWARRAEKAWHELTNRI